MQKKNNKNKKDVFAFIFGIAIIFFSLMPIIAMQNASLPYRTMYTPLIGAAIIVDYLVGRIKWKEKYAFLTMFAFLFIFAVGCVSEINDYKTVSCIDALICENIIKVFDENALSPEREVYVLGAKRSYTELSVLHNEHITSVMSSDWALTGAIRYYFKGYIKKVVPIKSLEDENLNTSACILALNDDFSVSIIRE